MSRVFKDEFFYEDNSKLIGNNEIYYDSKSLDKYIKLNKEEISDFLFKLKVIENLKADVVMVPRSAYVYDGVLTTNHGCYEFCDCCNRDIEDGKLIYKFKNYWWRRITTHYLTVHNLPTFGKEFYDLIVKSFNSLNLIVLKPNSEYNGLPTKTLTENLEKNEFIEKICKLNSSITFHSHEFKSCLTPEEYNKLDFEKFYYSFKNYIFPDKFISFLIGPSLELEINNWYLENIFGGRGRRDEYTKFPVCGDKIGNICIPEIFYRDIMSAEIRPKRQLGYNIIRSNPIFDEDYLSELRTHETKSIVKFI